MHKVDMDLASPEACADTMQPSTVVDSPAALRVEDEALRVEEVLGSYHSDSPSRCGVTGCPAMHTNGLRVRLSDGLQTNVGRECGRRHFPASMPAALRAFEQRRALNEQDLALQSVRDRLDALFARVASLRRGAVGTDWCVEARKDLLSCVGPEIANELRDRARRDDAEIQSLEGTDRGETAVPRALAGLSFINTYPELRLEALRVRLFELAALDFATLAPHKRRDWVRWATGIEGELQAVEQALAEALKFLARSNLELLPMLSPTVEGRARARRASGSWKLPKIPAVS